MPVSMGDTGWGLHDSDANELAASAGTLCPYQQQCRSCGFEPDDVVGHLQYCPKCGGCAWERFAIPGAFLIRSDRKKPSSRLNTSNAWAIGLITKKRLPEADTDFPVPQ